ncbi:MAG TPA: hypothetical protein VN726_00215 [Hanamia sp.]|nr:hypothetical protein [Hanamia sp.]
MTEVKPILLRYGGAKRSTFEMNETELKEAAESILKRAKEKAFSKGLPIYFSIVDRVFVEYSDGRIEEINKSA